MRAGFDEHGIQVRPHQAGHSIGDTQMQLNGFEGDQTIAISMRCRKPCRGIEEVLHM
jgi:hypothetical protein